MDTADPEAELDLTEDFENDTVARRREILMLRKKITLVDREADTQKFLELISEVESGRSMTLLIDGPAGSGKSRILAEFTRLAKERKLFVVDGSVTSIFRLEPPPLKNGESAEASENLQADNLDEDTPGADAESQHRPLLITLEDMKKGDESWLMVILAALPCPLPSSTMWLLTCDSGCDRKRLATFASKVSSEKIEIIHLRPLEGSAVKKMIAEILEARPAPGLLALAAGAAGNPLLIVELIEGLKEERGIKVQGGHALLLSERIPTRIRKIFKEWINDLDLLTRSLLYSAAYCRSSFTIEEVSKLLGVGFPFLVPVIEDAMERNLLVMRRENKLEFRHALFRQTLAEQLPDPDWRTQNSAGEYTTPPVKLQIHSPSRSEKGNRAWESLTGPQRVVASLVMKGLTNRQVAAHINISPHTVSYHLRQIFLTLKVNSRTELSYLFREKEI